MVEATWLSERKRQHGCQSGSDSMVVRVKRQHGCQIGSDTMVVRVEAMPSGSVVVKVMSVYCGHNGEWCDE